MKSDVDLNQKPQPAALSPNTQNREEFSLTVLLALNIITLFFVSPLIDINGSNRWILNLFIAMSAVVSIFVVDNGIRRWMAVLSLGFCMIGVAVGPLVADKKASAVILMVSALIFSCNVCWIVASRVFASGPVSRHRIRGAIVIYLNIALVFALLGSLLVLFVPGAYSNLPKNSLNQLDGMIYFSLSTITTVGYGDLTPVHPLARSLAMLEAVAGQFYIAILIGTLVSQFVSKKRTENFLD